MGTGRNLFLVCHVHLQVAGHSRGSNNELFVKRLENYLMIIKCYINQNYCYYYYYYYYYGLLLGHLKFVSRDGGGGGLLKSDGNYFVIQSCHCNIIIIIQVCVDKKEFSSSGLLRAIWMLYPLSLKKCVINKNLQFQWK